MNEVKMCYSELKNLDPDKKSGTATLPAIGEYYKDDRGRDTYKVPPGAYQIEDPSVQYGSLLEGLPIACHFHDPCNAWRPEGIAGRIELVNGYDGWSTIDKIYPKATAARFLVGYYDQEEPSFHVYGVGLLPDQDIGIPENQTPGILIRFQYLKIEEAAIEQGLKSALDAGAILFMKLNHKNRSVKDCKLQARFGFVVVKFGNFVPCTAEYNKAAAQVCMGQEPYIYQQNLLHDYAVNYIRHSYDDRCFVDGLLYWQSYVISSGGALVKPLRTETKQVHPEQGLNCISEVNEYRRWESLPPGSIVLRIEYKGFPNEQLKCEVLWGPSERARTHRQRLRIAMLQKAAKEKTFSCRHYHQS